MKRRTLIACLLAFFITIVGTALPATAYRWELIGERTVRLVADRDIIPVSSRKKYSHLKLRVKETGIQLMSMTVRLGSGRTVNPPLRYFIPKNGETRVIDLPGEDRVITSVTLVYKSRPGSTQRAIVQLYGRAR